VSDHPDLAALLADPARAAEVPSEERQALLDALAVHEGRCQLVRNLLIASFTGSGEAKNGSQRLQPPYTLHEAAGLLLKSPAWLRRRAQAGAIPGAKKIGRSWVFPRAEFHRFCQRCQIG
jgi:Helix-turn-helix domain